MLICYGCITPRYSNLLVVVGSMLTLNQDVIKPGVFSDTESLTESVTVTREESSSLSSSSVGKRRRSKRARSVDDIEETEQAALTERDFVLVRWIRTAASTVAAVLWWPIGLCLGRGGFDISSALV